MLGGIEKSEVTPPPTKKTQGTNQNVLRPRPASPPYQKSSHSASVHARMCNSPSTQARARVHKVLYNNLLCCTAPYHSSEMEMQRGRTSAACRLLRPAFSSGHIEKLGPTARTRPVHFPGIPGHGRGGEGEARLRRCATWHWHLALFWQPAALVRAVADTPCVRKPDCPQIAIQMMPDAPDRYIS